MEQYLTFSQIQRYPAHQKFKKTSYGGSKIFIKENIENKYGKIRQYEYYFYNGIWRMSLAERRRARYNSVTDVKIRAHQIVLQNEMIKKPINLSIGKEQYLKLYDHYEDADALGYYKKNSPEYVRVKDILSSVKKKSLVYDVGCNSGGIGRLLIQENKCTVYGSEICPSLGKKASQKGLNVFIGWAERTPYEDEMFDYAIMTFILEHVINPQLLMRETMRVLKEGGCVVGHVPTALGDWGRKTIGKHPEHLRTYSKRELKKTLQGSGLRSIQIEKVFLIGRTVADYYFFRGTK